MMGTRRKLPDLCRFGKTMLERKLLLYMASKRVMPYEARFRDSSNYQEEDLPELMGEYEFVPFFEIGFRIFLFQFRKDRDAAVAHFESMKPKKRERKKRERKKRVRSRAKRTRRPANR